MKEIKESFRHGKNIAWGKGQCQCFMCTMVLNGDIINHFSRFRSICNSNMEYDYFFLHEKDEFSSGSIQMICQEHVMTKKSSTYLQKYQN